MNTISKQKKQTFYSFFQILILLAISVMILSSCASQNFALNSFKISLVNKHTLKIDGEIDKETSKIFTEILDNNPEINKIVLTSGGGDVRYSIPIAERIYDREISIEVEKYAMSSAFNYFVLAAKETTINESSVLGYHGSANGSVPWIAKLLLAKTMKAEKSFLKKIGRSENFFIDLDNEIETYIINNNLTDVDFTFIMIGKSFFDKHNFIINQNSYFPSMQDELNIVVNNILKENGSKKELKMLGMF